MSVSAPRTKQKPAAQKKTEAQPVAPWLVVVLNDPVNLMSYVVLVFKRVFGFPDDQARRHMLEVHEKGRSVVWSGERERAESYVHQLHGWQLNARLERGSDGR
jgi:ATP-dependent Clp protease adaptor protein ClpS